MFFPFNKSLEHVFEQRRAFVDFAKGFGFDFSRQLPVPAIFVESHTSRYRRPLCSDADIKRQPVKKIHWGVDVPNPQPEPKPQTDMLPDGTKALHTKQGSMLKPQKKKGRKK